MRSSNFPLPTAACSGARAAHWRSRSRPVDTAYVCPNSLKSALLPWLAGIPKRVGYRGEARVGLLTQRLPNPPKGQRPPMVAFYSALSGESWAGGRPAASADADAGGGRRRWPHLACSAAGYYVFAPGAEYGPAKRWPARTLRRWRAAGPAGGAAGLRQGGRAVRRDCRAGQCLRPGSAWISPARPRWCRRCA